MEKEQSNQPRTMIDNLKAGYLIVANAIATVVGNTPGLTILAIGEPGRVNEIFRRTGTADANVSAELKGPKMATLYACMLLLPTVMKRAWLDAYSQQTHPRFQMPNGRLTSDKYRSILAQITE